MFHFKFILSWIYVGKHDFIYVNIFVYISKFIIINLEPCFCSSGEYKSNIHSLLALFLFSTNSYLAL